MTLVEQIDSELNTALKSGQSDRVDVLRLIKSGLKNEQIKLGHELSDDEALKVIGREAKQRRDSITAYEQGGRAELARAEAAELAIIEGFLPQQLGEVELGRIIDEAIANTGATSASQMGQVIGAVMAKVGPGADGGTVSRLVRERLGA